MTAHSAALDADYTMSLASLAGFSAAPTEFWSTLAQTVLRQTDARAVWILWRGAGDDAASWRILTQLPTAAPVPPVDGLSTSTLRQLSRDGVLPASLLQRNVAIALLQTGQDHQQILLMAEGGQACSPESLRKLTGFAAMPLVFETQRQVKSAVRDAARLAQALETMARIQDADGFDKAAIRLTNDLAEHFACETVSISWKAFEGLRLRATSHAEKIDRRSEATSLLEEAGQESLTQAKEVLWPATDQTQVTNAHDAYAAMVKPGHMVTLPLMIPDQNGTPVGIGAVTLERRLQPFSMAEQWALRLYCEMAQSPLHWHAQNARVLPVRLWQQFTRSLPTQLKPVTGAGRSLLLGLGLLIIAALFTPLPFRITASAVLKTDATAYVGAAYDGYIDASTTILGQRVNSGDALFTLNTAELTLERNALIAELAQSNRDAEIRRSLGQLSQMQLAMSKADELKAKLLKIDQKLAGSTAKAPIAGVVVEGEPAKKIGEAVRRGEAQVTISALSSLYVEAAVSEKDLSFVLPQQDVTLTLLARPKDSFKMQVAQAVPAPQIQDADNVFPVRMTDPENRADWWLPGMTGVVKISAGSKPLWWIASRRLVDYLRLALWF